MKVLVWLGLALWSVLNQVSWLVFGWVFDYEKGYPVRLIEEIDPEDGEWIHKA